MSGFVRVVLAWQVLGAVVRAGWEATLQVQLMGSLKGEQLLPAVMAGLGGSLKASPLGALHRPCVDGPDVSRAKVQPRTDESVAVMCPACLCCRG